MIPDAVHHAAADARARIVHNMQTTHDPVQKVMGGVAYAYATVGEGFSHFGLVTAQGKLLGLPGQLVGISPTAAANARKGVDLQLYYKPGWTEAQRKAAAEKAAALTDANTVVVKRPRRIGTSAASRYRQAGNDIPEGHDVDHVVDLQLDGADDILNMKPLDASVNRSLGAQIHQRIRTLPPQTRVNRVKIKDR